LEQISCLFSDWYGYGLNRATVERALEEGYAPAAALEAETQAQLKQAEVAHFDETGLRVGGRLQWLHTASNARYTHLFVHEKRSEQAWRSAASVLPEFRGWAIHDHLAAYYRFTQAKHGACNAHILRELQGLMENGSAWGDQAELEEPPPEPRSRGRPKSTPGRNLLRRLTEHEEAVLAFARVAGVPFTHNQAERDRSPYSQEGR